MNRYHRLFELARKRLRSDADYVEFQEFQARWITETLESEIRDRQVLDLGCGNGGYSNYFSEMAKEVVALDFAVPEGLKPGIRFVRQTSATLPFEEHSFDFIFCASVIEHVEDPKLLLSEIKRVLKATGKAYISFPPFYSLNGGHQFKPFHYLPERWALSLYNLIHGQSVVSYKTADGTWGLYRRSIGQVAQWIRDSGFVILKQRTRFTKLPLDKIPYLSNFLCWHVEFMVASPDD